MHNALTANVTAAEAGNHKTSLDAMWNALNDPRRWPTPKATIDAILFCVRERGASALSEPANVERLSRCDAAARVEINRRMLALGK